MILHLYMKPELNDANSAVLINGYTIPISENGIEVEWWENNSLTENQIKGLLPENIRRYIDLGTIHQEKDGILGYVFEDHNVNNMVREEIVDWLESRGLQPEVTDNQDIPSVDLVTDQVQVET